jgi:uroporphyrinogen decarboxylase
MNGYQRIQAALNGQETDYVPVMLHNFMMAAREAGVSMSAFRNNPGVMADTFIRSVEKYRFDGILVDLDTVTLAGALGASVDFPENEPARSTGGNLKNLSDLRKLRNIRIEDYRYVNNWLEGVRLIKERVNDDIFIRGNCDQAPFSLASMVRGSQLWMEDLLEAEPPFVKELLEYCTEVCCRFIRLMAQTGCDMLSNGDSPAGPEMISPEMYKMFALPYERELVEEAHACGLPYALHICGNTESILELMLETGADAFELDYKTDSQKAFNILHDKACFIGNIDPSGVLALGNVEMVKRKTVELLEIFSKTNRFILNAGCAIPPDTPEENLRMMIDTALTYKRL